MLVVLGVAAQLAIVAHAPDSVSACDPVEVSVAVSNRGREIPRLVVPPFRPFDVLGGSAHPRLEYSGRSSLVAEYRYILTTDRSGRYVIPAFEAHTSTGRVASAPLEVTVGPRRTRPAPAVVTRARIDTSGELRVLSGAPAAAETVFVGQQATYEVAVFLNPTMRERLRRNPTFYPPEMQAVLAYDLPATPSNTSYRIGSQCFDALVYRRALFPLVAGRLTIPPAQLVYSTGLSSTTLFSREESHELQTDSVTIVALEPPAASRPPHFTGAVGDLRVAAAMDSVARVGDPMLLTVSVSGKGNVRLFPRPDVGVPWASIVEADERVRVDSASARIGGVKEFDWVLTPRIAGEFDLPPLRYGYYDPATRRYGSASTEPRRIRIGGGALAAADTGTSDGPLGIRTRYTGASWPPPHTHPVFWALMAIAPIPALVARVRNRSARKTRANVVDPMRMLSMGRGSREPVALRRQYVRALAVRIGCSPADFTHPGALDRALRRAGVRDDTAARAEALLRDLDAAAYSPERPVPANAAREAGAIARAVDEEALSRAELPFWLPVMVIGAALALASAAMAENPAGAHFARGVSEYVRQEYVAAAKSFGSAAALEPRAADAWANFGTASYSAGDTASAAYGWRQALAIDPAAPDVRQRMLLLRDEGPSAPGWVPSVPAHAAVWLFAALWIGAWTLAWIARRPGSWAAGWPARVGTAAVVVGLAAMELESRIEGSRLGVVRRATSLSSDPALGMDRGPSLGTGEIVRVLGRRGGWTRVEATADREGWIASSELIPLESRRPPGE
ncbi:MAG TPA: BatD family protein [Gemmatimonadaceae bacterium]|nr:BatD family protein [Gemmatimonadaceae bacterium]